MGHIVVLDQNMINMIAAGEVIERPASVVKEVTENSIDAGATKITVSVEDGGRKLISIADNGCGMDAEDLGQAFEPHTTSKIKASIDLQAISTLGFRGEALASISSVAQVRAISRTKDSQQGNCIEIDCGDNSGVSPCSADSGTTIQIRDLFYKLPARRKFLKTANTEMGHISEQFKRITLANSKLDMTLIHNERELFRLPGGQGLTERIGGLFSSEIAENLMVTESDEKGLKIRAFLGKPVISKTNSKSQYVFLNGRFIRDKFISHAIREAYRPVTEPNRFPVVFLFIQMPYEDYDVNVHPTKTEVRFYNANLVHSQILGCLREKLLSTNLDVKANIPHHPTGHSRGEKINEAMSEFFKQHRPSATQPQFGFGSSSGTKRSFNNFQPHAQPEHIRLPLQKRFMQIHDSFIIAQSDEGFVIVDQHALHERMIYENLRRSIQSKNLESQRLLIPESFELTDSQAELLKTHSQLIEKLGIEIGTFGPQVWAIQAFPTLLAKAVPLDFVQDLLEMLEGKDDNFDGQRLLDDILNMAACKAAIKAGQKLTDNEIEQLLSDKESTEASSHCPHGRPTTITFSMAQLEKQFKRT